MKREDYIKLLAVVEDARNECERIRTLLAKLHAST
jgi:hypothetical protein